MESRILCGVGIPLGLVLGVLSAKGVLIAATGIIGAVLGYVFTVFMGAADTGSLQLVAVPIFTISEASIVSIAACLLATAIPLRQVGKMSIVESIETVE